MLLLILKCCRENNTWFDCNTCCQVTLDCSQVASAPIYIASIIEVVAVFNENRKIYLLNKKVDFAAIQTFFKIFVRCLCTVRTIKITDMVLCVFLMHF